MSKKLKVIAKRDGFRRAGFAFSATQETVLDTADLTKEQIKALKEEVNLVVIEVEDDEKKAPAKKDDKKNTGGKKDAGGKDGGETEPPAGGEGEKGADDPGAKK